MLNPRGPGETSGQPGETSGQGAAEPSDAVSQTLPPGERIRRRRDFQHVFDAGRRTTARFLTLVAVRNGLPVGRVGIAASRRLGDAVRRNRAKRLVREIVRRHKPAPGYDIVVIPRPELLHAEFATLEADYRAALRRSVRG